MISHQLTVQCRQKKRTPCDMTRGSAANDGRFVYITSYGSTSLYQYECSTEELTELPSCPYKDSGLAIIDSELTTVGGYGADRLFTRRQGKWLRQWKWVEVYPPMNTARDNPAVVSTSDGDYLIAIGGWVTHPSGVGGFGSVRWTTSVFQVKSKRWCTLTDLPQCLIQPSATICGDLLHVIGNDGDGYSCSLQSLPSNDRPITSPLTLSWKPLPPLPVSSLQSLPSNDRPITSPLTLSWKPLPPLPVKESTAATLCGQLVLIGGVQGLSSVNSIHQLVEGQWVEIGSMTSRRRQCLAVSLSPDRILIVGGYFESSVEECVAV